MRDYAKIHTALWESRKFMSLPDDDSRLLYLYLHTCKFSNMIGCFTLNERYAVADLGWAPERYGKAIATLCKANLIGFDSRESLVRIVDFIKHDPFTNPKHAAGAVNMALKLPECDEKQRLIEDLAAAKHVNSSAFGERLSKGYRNPEPEPEPEPEPKEERKTDAGKPASCAFAAFWAVWPSKIAKASAEKAWRKLRDVDREAALASAQDWFSAWRRAHPDAAPIHPATYLNQRRWQDEPPDVAPKREAPRGPHLWNLDPSKFNEDGSRCQ